MAKVTVGCQLSWQGKPVICTAIHTHTETSFARTDSQAMRLDINSHANVKLIAQEWDDFSEGDIISYEYQKIELTELGKNLFYLYSYYKIKKEGLQSEPTGTSDSIKAKPSSSQADRSGDQSGKGSGESSLGKDSDSQNGSGQSGAGGEHYNPEVGEAGQHATSHYGDCDSGGAGDQM